MTEQINSSTLANEVADRMREMLVSGEFAAGERLTMRALKTRFGISHIPIREALRVLEVEGLIENTPQRGAVAVAVSPDILAEIYDARRLLEPTLAARSALHATDDQIARLAEALADMERAEATGGDFLEPHARFHRVVLESSSTPTLTRFLRQLWGISERYIRLSTSEAGPLPQARDQHQLIYELMARRDEAVHEVVDAHLRLVEARYLASDEAPAPTTSAKNR